MEMLYWMSRDREDVEPGGRRFAGMSSLDLLAGTVTDLETDGYVGTRPAPGQIVQGTVLARRPGRMQDPHPRSITVWVAGERNDELETIFAWGRRLREMGTARAGLPDAVRQAVADGMTQSDAARAAGVTRATVRSWLDRE